MSDATARLDLTNYKSGTESIDAPLTYTAADKSAGLSAGVAGLGGSDTFNLDATGTYVGGSGSDTFNLSSALVGQYTVVGSEPSKVQPLQIVWPVEDIDVINIGSAIVTAIDLSAGRITGTNANGAFTVNFSGVERIWGAPGPSGYVVTGTSSAFGFNYWPSGSDRITSDLSPETPWLPGTQVLYGGGSFNAAGINVSYDSQGIGKVTSPAFPTAAGDRLERVVSIVGTSAADTFDMRNFGTNAIGTKMHIVAVSAGDIVQGNGETRMVVPGWASDLTRRTIIDLVEGSFEPPSWTGAVKFSGVKGLYGSIQDEAMLGDDRDNFFRPEDGNDFVDGRGGIDTLGFTRQADPVSIDMAAGITQGGPSSNTDIFRRIEVVSGSVHADLYDATGFGTAQAVNVGDAGTYNAFRPLGGDDVIIGNGQTHVLYDTSVLAVEVNLAQGFGRARLVSERSITDERNVGADKLSGVTGIEATVFADSLTGDAANNELRGNAGNDTIDGGAGQDIAVYSGKRADYTITPLGNAQFTISDNRTSQIQDSLTGTWSLSDGSDQLSNIEILRFADGDLSLAGATQTFTPRTAPQTTAAPAPVDQFTTALGFKRGTESADAPLTYTAADKSEGLSAGVAGLGGSDTFNLDATGTYVGGSGSDTFNLSSALVGQYTVVGSEPSKVQPRQIVQPVDDFDSINIGSAIVTAIDLSADRITGTNTNGAFTVNFSGVERIWGAPGPSGYVVTGTSSLIGFQYWPSGSDRITSDLSPETPWLPGTQVLYGGGSFNAAGINVSYDLQGIGKVTSPAFPTATGDRLERVAAISGTAAADTFDMRNFGTNAMGTKMHFVVVSAGDIVQGNGETRMVVPGWTSDLTRRTVIDLAEGSFEPPSWTGAVKFSGVKGLVGSAQDETMLGDERDNIFRPEDGNDFVDGRAGIDTLEFFRQADPISIDMAAGVAKGGPSSNTDIFRRIEVVSGSVHADLYDATGFGTAQAVNVGDAGTYNAFRPLGGDDVIIGNGQTHVLYDTSVLAVEVNLAQGFGRARLVSERSITDERNVGADKLSGVTGIEATVFADSLTGDAANNELRGNAGNDTIDGGAGQDIAVYSGKRADYTITPLGNAQFTISDNRTSQIQDSLTGTWSLSDGSDQLSNIEILRFADLDFSLESMTPVTPTISGIAYHWKSHAILNGVEIKTLPVSVTGTAAQSPFKLKNFVWGADGNGSVEIWAESSGGIENLGVELSMSEGTFTGANPSTALNGWLLAADTVEGRFSAAAIASSLPARLPSGSVKLGSLSFETGTATRIDFRLEFGELGMLRSDPFVMSLAKASSESDGFRITELELGSRALQANRSAADAQGAINSADALATLQIAIGRNPNLDPDGVGSARPPKLSPYQIMAADVIGTDGLITSADALAILNMAIGKSGAMEPEWMFVEESRDFWDETANNGQGAFILSRRSAHWSRDLLVDLPDGKINLVGVLKGDVDGSWAPPEGSVDLDIVYPTYFQELSTLIGSPLDQWHA